MADDYSFMKSGFENLVHEDEDPTENIASIVLVFMENAVKNAAIYTKHSKRNGITPEDIKRGLMLETFFIKQRPNMLEQCEEMKQIISKINYMSIIGWIVHGNMLSSTIIVYFHAVISGTLY